MLSLRHLPHFILLCVPLASPLVAHAATPTPTLPPYIRQDVMIPMRDGVLLHAAILRPAHAGSPLPFLLTRTPYGVEDATAQAYPQEHPFLAGSGYIFVEEDIRGRYGSGGTFVMMRPLAAHHDAKAFPADVDESTDASDTVSWLLAHVPANNGRVGVFGVSYPGFLTMEAGIDPNPAVKAISPQAPMTDVWLGDDFFHNGAFRQTYGYDYGLGMESSKQNAFAAMPPGEDAYTFFLKAGSFARAIASSGSPDLPTWQAFLAHPAYDNYWQARAVEPHLQPSQLPNPLPTLEVGGFWDQEDMWGPQEEYARLHRSQRDAQIRIVLGPWNHGEWQHPAESLGALDWGQPTGTMFQRDMEAPFFAHYLKDAPLDLPNTSSFQTGTNRWMHYAAWPPTTGVTLTPIYLQSNGRLSFDLPTGAAQAVAGQYVSDPANPIPYRARPIEATYSPAGSHWYTWLAQDQRAFTLRKDQATWQIAPLAHTMTLTGDVKIDLWAASSGTDADWVVKLIDAYPVDDKLGKMSGYQLMVAEEIFRGRYRSGFSNPQPIAANTPLEYQWSLHGVDHALLPGHRLLVEVQSTWFPLYDRNPQQFLPNIMKAKPEDFRKASQTIYGSPSHASRLLLPLVTASADPAP
jgi:putative CocE/NonD family hydrolase